MTIQNILGGIAILLFLHLCELLLSSLLHEYRLLSSKVFTLSVIYLILGILVGGVSGILAVFFQMLDGQIRLLTRISSGPILVWVFTWFYVIAVLNAFFLPESPLLSKASIGLNVAFIVASIPVLIILGRVGEWDDGKSSLGKALSISFSVAAVLVLAHNSVATYAEKHGRSQHLLAIAAFGYLFIAAFISLGEITLLRRLTRKLDSYAKARVSITSALIKPLVVVVVLAFIFNARRARPLLAERELVGKVPPQDAPNIVLIILDAVRQDRLSPYGCEFDTTPNLADLAGGALVFDAYSTSQWTLPSHATIVTGLYPTENGTGIQKSLAVDDENVVLAEILAGIGYKTGAVIANYASLGHESGIP